ncbi:MAG: prolyl-tRNA synthetase associated domain-containing protein, partial [Alphaproteobacteria bacterium]|nr:prolyl-tRNA synthetase associated domain-containing protein [Alphaproteobacteria bacterium]
MKTSPADSLPTTPQVLFPLLGELGIVYELYHHEPIFTVEEGEHLEASIPGIHCRNLFLRDKKGVMYLVVLANDTRLDLKKLEGLIGSARLSFGSPERLWAHLGIRPGGVCPFTVINDPERRVNLLPDEAMMAAERVCYHPLDNAMTVSLA